MTETARSPTVTASKRTELALVAATGVLGSGFREESIEQAIELGAAMIGCDAGSTDAGPHALATGVPMFSRAAVKRDMDVLLRHAVAAGIPLVIGSAGTAGAAVNLAWLQSIVREIAAERALHFSLALIEAEQPKATVKRLNAQGRIRPLPPSQPLSDAEIDESLHIVAMMGVEPIQEALQAGASVVLAGRASDTAIYAALPLLHGCEPGITWHAAKILECGAAAVTQRAAPDSMFAVLRNDSFDIRPLREDYRCTPQSIASHSFYENADPFLLREPGGTLDLHDARYEALSDRAVTVSGGRFLEADEYSVKLEGARLAGYSTVVPAGVRDPLILGQLDDWLEGLEKNLAVRLASVFGEQLEYELVLRAYGRDGVMGALEPQRLVNGHEVLLLWDVISASQELSRSIATSLAHMAAHYPIPEWSGLITGVAFPFAPAEVDRGPVYEFHLNHVAMPDDPLQLFPITYETV
jgi:hypothetical protein